MSDKGVCLILRVFFFRYSDEPSDLNHVNSTSSSQGLLGSMVVSSTRQHTETAVVS